MILTFERTNLIKKLLDPISKVTESCSLTLLPDKTQTVVASPDGSIILYSQFLSANANVTSPVTVNMPNIRKLMQVFECIEDPFVDLKLESNHLAYNSPTVKFKYFLLDDGVIETTPLKTEKIDALQFQNGFRLNGTALTEMIKGSSFTDETNKVYISTTGKEVFAELTDHTVQNTNSLTCKLADKFVGEKLDQIPLNMDVIRLLGSLKVPNILVKINTQLKVVLFEIIDKDCILKFIVSPLIK
jgi:hypothetical protein